MGTICPRNNICMTDLVNSLSNNCHKRQYYLGTCHVEGPREGPIYVIVKYYESY